MWNNDEIRGLSEIVLNPEIQDSKISLFCGIDSIPFEGTYIASVDRKLDFYKSPHGSRYQRLQIN